MKKRCFISFVICIVSVSLAACGVTTEKKVESQTEQAVSSDIALQTESLEREIATETEIVSETEPVTETESTSLPRPDEMRNAYEAFLNDDATAILDEDFFVFTDDTHHPAGETITLQEIISEATAIGENAGKCSYTCMEEFPEKPILTVRISGLSPYADENNIIFFVLYEEDGLHITDIENNTESAMGYNILSKEGLYAYNEHVTGGAFYQDAKILDENGKLFLLYSEYIYSGTEISYHQPYGVIYDQIFSENPSWCSISEAMLGGFQEGGERIYTIYPEGDDFSEAEKYFIDVCNENGIELLERKDTIKIAENYAAEKGYIIDILKLDDNAVEWTEL